MSSREHWVFVSALGTSLLLITAVAFSAANGSMLDAMRDLAMLLCAMAFAVLVALVSKD